MKNLLEQAFKTPDNPQDVPSFMAFKEVVSKHKSDTVTVCTYIDPERELNIIKAVNTMTLTRGKTLPMIISSYSEDYYADIEEFKPERFINACVLTALHRILAFLHQNPDQKIVYFSPFDASYNLSNEKDALAINKLRQRLKEKGAIIFPVISEKPAPQGWKINKFRL